MSFQDRQSQANDTAHSIDQVGGTRSILNWTQTSFGPYRTIAEKQLSLQHNRDLKLSTFHDQLGKTMRSGGFPAIANNKPRSDLGFHHSLTKSLYTQRDGKKEDQKSQNTAAAKKSRAKTYMKTTILQSHRDRSMTQKQHGYKPKPQVFINDVTFGDYQLQSWREQMAQSHLLPYRK